MSSEAADTPPAVHRLASARRLLWLNGGLLAALACATLVGHFSGAPASAQPVDPATGVQVRNRGDYTVVSGRYQGGTTSAVYILDAANQQILALKWDRTNARFDLVGLRSITDDAREQRAPR